jgi:hypothetical protein
MITPLKYTPTTTKSLAQLKTKVSAGTVIDSYLLFSGDMELSLAESDYFICAHTNKYVVYEFWHTLMEDHKRIYDIIACDDFHFVEPQYEILQEKWAHYKDPYVRSALFFMLNRLSETGEISSGKLTPGDYNKYALANLAGFYVPENFYLMYDKNDDFIDSIKPSELSEVVLIRAGNFKYNLFEEGISRGDETVIFNHRKLKEKLDSLDKRKIIIYNYHPYLLSLYKDYDIDMINKYGKVTKNKGDCVELFISKL